MKALCWYGKHDVRLESVPDPKLLNAQDAIVAVSSTAICGSDLHLYGGYIPSLKAGDILGHEFMGEVVEVGADVRKLKVGDRVVVPFVIACGQCALCSRGLHALCDNSNPNHALQEAAYGQASAGLFGYTHMLGGYAGGQAEYVRVPFADVGPVKVPKSLSDEQVLFLSDILPTGYQAVEVCSVRPGQTVAVWGCGPVGLCAMRSAQLLGAERVIGIDRLPERLRMAQAHCGAIVIKENDPHTSVQEALRDLTQGRGPDICIDAVGLEAHGAGLAGFYDEVKFALNLQTDKPTVLRACIMACAKGGTVSIPGVYGGVVDKFPLGAAFGKGLTLRMGQTHVHRYVERLLQHVEDGSADMRFLVTHRRPLAEAAEAYRDFQEKNGGCVKTVLRPS